MRLMEKLENMFAAVAFAEEGEHETSVRIMEEGKRAGELDGAEGLGRGASCEGNAPHPAKA